MRLAQSLLVLLLFSSQTFANEKVETYASIRVLSATLANRIATTAEQYCFRKGYQVSVAVSDRYGNLLAFSRNPLSGSHTIVVSQNKAYTAATFQSSTMNLATDLPFMQGVPRISLVGGGIPVRVAGHMYGAIGVSGAPAKKTPGDVDTECAQAGLDSIMSDLEFAD